MDHGGGGSCTIVAWLNVHSAGQGHSRAGGGQAEGSGSASSMGAANLLQKCFYKHCCTCGLLTLVALDRQAAQGLPLPGIQGDIGGLAAGVAGRQVVGGAAGIDHRANWGWLEVLGAGVVLETVGCGAMGAQWM